MIYLDNAATTLPKPPGVISAVHDALSKIGSLGRSSHGAAAFASETAFSCRKLAASMFDAKAENVVFTFNATHGLNIAIKSLIKEGERVVISGFEHNAVIRPLHRLNADIVIAGRKVFDQGDTILDFESKINTDTKAVICTHVSNVFGYVLPIAQISKICRERNVPLIIDASQSAGILPVSLKDTGAAFIAMPGHKSLFGPQGTGILLCADTAQPILDGGTGSISRSKDMPEFLPDRLEAGTMNMHGIAGLLEGLYYVQKLGSETIASHESTLIESVSKALNRELYDVYTPMEQGGQTGVLSIVPRYCSCEYFSELCSKEDIAVRVGLHCAPIAHESVGTIDSGTVRLSVSALTEETDMKIFAEFANEIIMKI